jgi:hypothetical protein
VLHFLAEEGIPKHKNERYSTLQKNARAAVHAISAGPIAALATDTDRVRRSTQNGLNMFTDSHLLLAVAVLHRSGRLASHDGSMPVDDTALASIRKSALQVWETNKELLAEWQGGRIHSGDENHDFVTLHAVRAADALGLVTSAEPVWEAELGIRIRNSVLLQLGRHAAGITSQFDPAELAFSVALLYRFRTPDFRPMTQRSLQVIADAQTSDGAWPTSRLVSYGEHHLLFPASFEVALTLTDLLISELAHDSHQDSELLTVVLERTYRLVKNTFMSLGKQSGWSNDRVRSPGRLESWATAIVVSFLVRYREALLRLRQSAVLKKYEVTTRAAASFPWPDLAPLLGEVHQPDPNALAWISDPTEEGNLREAINTRFIAPVIGSPVRRPENVSLLLPGPPGTRKTTMVERVAEALGWPLLTLTPPDFLGSGGLEQFEATAAAVFRDLMRLRRVVVLFDECEDFFRRRDSSGSPAGRTMGAFITAGMLPRLQRLHRNRWLIFVLATNAELKELDEAVIRPGRFDFQHEMRNPTLGAQKRYVDQRVSDGASAARLYRALVSWTGRNQGKDKDKHEVSFAVLDRLLERIHSGQLADDPESIRRAIQESLESGPPPLV